MFTGSIVALVTPMLSSGDVDDVSLRRLVEFHIEQGTKAIVAVGTTGESPTLPIDEHVEVVAKVVEYSAGRISVIAGSGANSTTEALELGARCEAAGVDGLLSVVPYYNKPQDRGLVAHFKTIADESKVPVILYNVPGRTVTDMPDDVVVTLAKHPNIVALKDATGDVSRLTRLKAKLPNSFLFLSGDDETACEFLINGGHGIISVSANIVPREMNQMCQAARDGQHQLASDINSKVCQLHSSLFLESNPVIPKHALYKMGLIDYPVLRLPLVQAELSHQVAIEAVLSDIGII